MELPANYEMDILFFFGEKQEELRLYNLFFDCICTAFPEASVRVQKSQISFYGRHFFAAASLPLRRKKGWPEHSLLITFGLPCRLDSPRIAVAVEPYPGRWTHHVLVSREEQLDEELFEWVSASWAFSESKRKNTHGTSG